MVHVQNSRPDIPSVLISEKVLAAWLGLCPERDAQDGPESGDDGIPVGAEPTQEDIAQRAVEIATDLGEQPEGFVSALPVPEPGTLVVLDVRWSATNPEEGHATYAQGHIPGAVFASMNGQLAGHGAASAGRHPLPEPTKLAESMRMLGVNNGDTVVVYDNVSSQSAARAWWLLRHAGFSSVYVLDGGLAAWREADLPLQAGDVLPKIGDVHLSWGKMPVLKTEEIEDFSQEGVLLDARARQRFTGEHEPLDPVAGHIPTAVNVPIAELTDEHGRFLEAAQLAHYFEKAGVAVDDSSLPVGVYCGSGVSATALLLALSLVGVDAALYPGSFSAWANTPNAPVETGPEPGSF